MLLVTLRNKLKLLLSIKSVPSPLSAQWFGTNAQNREIFEQTIEG
jgi:hypothetical protein